MDYRNVILIVAAVFLVFATYLELKHNPTPGMALRAIFSNRTFNENLEKKRYEDKKEKFETRGIKKFITFIYIVGFALLGLGIFLTVAPHGNDSLSSENNEGQSVGDSDVSYINASVTGKNKTLASALNDINDESDVYIRVEENTIYLGDIMINDGQALSDCFRFISFDDKHVYLMDAYAVATTYHLVTDILSEFGVAYREGEEP